jgi:predicted acylesterase/phospholipase RssA
MDSAGTGENESEALVFEEICFAGGGTKGPMYLGSIKCLLDKGYVLSDFKKIIGVSIGSFISSLWLVGWDPLDALETILQQPFDEFFEYGNDFRSEYGILKLSKFKNFVLDTFKKQNVNEEFTLKNLFNKTGVFYKIGVFSLLCGGTWLSHETHPDMPLLTAVMASMSIPIMFPPVEYKGEYFVDGGCYDNCPDHMLGENGLAFRVDGNWKKKEDGGVLYDETPKNWKEYLHRLIQLGTKSGSQYKKTNCTEIRIQCPEHTFIDFEMGNDSKLTLYVRGYEATDSVVQNKIVGNAKVKS